MIPDTEILERFEKELNPQDLNASPIAAKIIGYGEISVIFEILDLPGIVYKRMPIFPNRRHAEIYQDMYRKYCTLLEEAGLLLPASDTCIVSVPGRATVLYIAQEKLPPERLGHTLIRHLDKPDCLKIFSTVISELEKIWAFNRRHRSVRELAIDGQISNWALPDEAKQPRPYYIDTSTPLFRLGGNEQLDPEPLLKSTPGFLRWIIRLLFLKDVMNRYYVPRLVYTDLAANLYKEQRPDLVADVIALINQALPESESPLTVSELDKYYKEDRLIWSVFLRFRKIDRWLQTKLLRKRYEFILPGEIIR